MQKAQIEKKITHTLLFASNFRNNKNIKILIN